jgi:hypothetical protein
LTASDSETGTGTSIPRAMRSARSSSSSIRSRLSSSERSFCRTSESWEPRSGGGMVCSTGSEQDYERTDARASIHPRRLRKDLCRSPSSARRSGEVGQRPARRLPPFSARRAAAVTWSEFDRLTTALARELLRLGFVKGDFLVTLLPLPWITFCWNMLLQNRRDRRPARSAFVRRRGDSRAGDSAAARLCLAWA